jgi:glycosyltransferase involved in cell wall biosynthesis
MSPLVEVRIPTYKRPEWLTVAIKSLLSQDFTDWRAMIFDDSTAREGELVVSQFNDGRLAYRPNEQNRGAAFNLNQCFTNVPYAGGTYAFVLEDDNWLMPDFISANLAAIQSSNVNFLFRNQEIWSRNGSSLQKKDGTTLPYFRKQMTPMQLHAQVFFWSGVSNGSIFFKTGTKTNLAVASLEPDPGLQEYLRCLAFEEDSLFLEEPKAVFSSIPIKDTARRNTDHRYFSAFVQALQARVFERYGKEILPELHQINQHLNGRGGNLNAVLANINKLGLRHYFREPRLLSYWSKGMLKSLVYRQRVNASL